MNAAVSTLIGRNALALIFVMSGAGKLAAYAATQQYMTSVGVSGALLPLVILAELGGGLAVMAGLLTRTAATGLAVFSIAAGTLFHADFADQNQMIHFLKNIAIAGGLLLLAANGPGALSLDALLARRRAGRGRVGALAGAAR